MVEQYLHSPIRLHGTVRDNFAFYLYKHKVGPCHIVTSFPQRRPGFEPRSDHVGFVVEKVVLGQVFSEYFSFPCQFSFHRLLHTHHRVSSGAGTIGQTVADVPSGLSLTPPQETVVV
jgi:hypothetical protein